MKIEMDGRAPWVLAGLYGSIFRGKKHVAITLGILILGSLRTVYL